MALLRGNGDLWDFRQDEARPPLPERPLRPPVWLHRPISSYEASIPLSEYSVRRVAWLHLGETELEGVSSDCFPASISISAKWPQGVPQPEGVLGRVTGTARADFGLSRKEHPY